MSILIGRPSRIRVASGEQACETVRETERSQKTRNNEFRVKWGQPPFLVDFIITKLRRYGVCIIFFTRLLTRKSTLSTIEMQ